MSVWQCRGGLWVSMSVYEVYGCLRVFIGMFRYFMGA